MQQNLECGGMVAQLAKLTVLIRIRAGSFVGGFGGLSPGLARHWKF